MTSSSLRNALLVFALGATALGGWAQAQNANPPSLTIAREGYLYAGGHYDQAHPDHHIVGQIYAEFQIPANRTHPYPIVMVHGGSQTGVDWLATPDGRDGWAQFFLRRGYAVYVVDQVGRGKSPYEPNVYGAMSGQSLEFDLQRFAAGEKYDLWPQAKLHTQWPGKAEPGDPVFDNYFSSSTPTMHDKKENRLVNIAALAALLDKIGPAIVLVHSQSGAFGWPLAQMRPGLVKALVAAEPSGPPVHDIDFHGPPNYFSDVAEVKAYGLTDTPVVYAPLVTAQSPLQFAQQEKPDGPGLARCWRQKEPARKIVALGDRPILILGAEASFYAGYNHCTVEYLEQAGVHPTFIRLADVGIRGNGHMMMEEKNSDQIAGVIAGWLDKNRIAIETASPKN